MRSVLVFHRYVTEAYPVRGTLLPLQPFSAQVANQLITVVQCTVAQIILCCPQTANDSWNKTYMIIFDSAVEFWIILREMTVPWVETSCEQCAFMLYWYNSKVQQSFPWCHCCLFPAPDFAALGCKIICIAAKLLQAVMTVVADVCTHTELELERQCLQEQRQQLESRHHELTAAAESLSSQLQVMHDAFVGSLFVQSLKWSTVLVSEGWRKAWQPSPKVISSL